MKHKPANKPIVNPEHKKASKAPKAATPVNPNSFLEKNAAWITLGLISLLVLIIFFDFILGNRFYLFKDIGSDSVNGYFPYLVNSARLLSTEGFPKWSFAMGMGQSVYPGGYADPFAFLINMAGLQNLAYGIILSDVSKFIVACLFFFLYLRVLELSKTASIIGSLLFSLSGFMIVAGSWYTFSLEVVYMAFLLYAFEKLYKRDNWFLFPIAIALIAMYSPFDIYLYGLFLVFYMLFRFFTEEQPRVRDFLTLVLKMAGLTMLGLLIGSVFFIPNLQRLIDSPRVTGNSSYFQTLMSKPVFSLAVSSEYVTGIMRAFGNDMVGNGSKFAGWYNYLEAPLFYIGLLPLVLFTQVFTFISRRKQIVYAAFFLIYLLAIIFPFFRNAYWAFTGDYYRGFSLFFSFAMLFFSLQVISELDKARRINLFVLGGTLAVLLALLYFPYENIDLVIRKDLQSAVTIFLFLYGITLLLFNFSNNRNALKITLIVLVCLELAYFNGKTVRERDSITKSEWRQKEGYNDYTVDAVSWLKETDKGFYRLNKDYASGPAIHRSMNDALVQDYFGTPCYSSFNQKYYIRFQEETGVIDKGVEKRTRWAPGLTTRPLLQLMGSVKYNLSKKEQSMYLSIGYNQVNQLGDVKVMKNSFFLPLGYTYDTYIPIGEFRKLPVLQRDFTLLKAFVAEEPVDPAFRALKVFSINDTAKTRTFGEVVVDVAARRADTLKITSFSNNYISGTISLKEDKVLFFSIPYDRGWKGRVDGKVQDPFLCNTGFMGLYLPKGEHKVDLSYEVYLMSLSIWLTVAGCLVLLILAAIRYRRPLMEKLNRSEPA